MELRNLVFARLHINMIFRWGGENFPIFIFGTIFQTLNENVVMEMRSNNNGEKRRRRIIQKGPVLVRSVKPGQLTNIQQYSSNTQTLASRLWS